MKNQEQIKKRKEYKWTKDKKILGLILASVTVIIFIFSFLRIPFLSSIHAYTFGMMFGYHSVFVYAFSMYTAMKLIFGDKMKFPKWFKLTTKTYWFLVLAVVFISCSSGFYQVETNSWFEAGSKPTYSMNVWWNAFTSSPGNEWVPTNTNGGFVGALFYLITGAMSTGTGVLIIAVILLVLSISILVTGSFIGLYKDIHNKRKFKDVQKNISDQENVIKDIKQLEKKKKVEPVPFDEDAFND